MAFLIILLIAVDVFLLVTKVRNSYTWMYVTMIMLIEVELIFTLLLYVKLYNYSMQNEWERMFQLFLGKAKINYYTIFDVFTYALAGYMTMSLMVALHEIKSSMIKRVAAVIAIIPIIVFAVINNHYVNMIFYLKMYTSVGEPYQKPAYLINVYNVITFAVYVLLPFAVFAVQTYKARITYRKKQLAVTCLYLLSIDFLEMFIFVQYVPYKIILTYAPNYLRLSTEIQSINVHIDLLWLAVLTVVMLLLMILAVKSKMFDKINLRKQYKYKAHQKMKIPFDDTYTVFHTCKNILMSVDFIGKSMERKNPSQEIMEDIGIMHTQISNGLGKLTHLLNLYNSQTEVIEDVKLTECIENAIVASEMPEDITVTRAYDNDSINISADSLVVEEVLINLLKNAAEAIIQKKENDGRIDIRVLTEGGWVCIYIRDNGYGIMHKDYKRIFTPLFSTKKTAQNWGVGLSFVHSAINSLGGQISLRSRYGKFTEFEILLPMIKEDRAMKKKKGVLQCQR